MNGILPTTVARDPSLSNPQATSSTIANDVPPSGTPLSTREPPAPYPTSFSQIVDLITTGQPIPGVKEVPDTLLTGQESQATTAKRRKPWEQERVGNVNIDNAADSMSTAPS